MKQVSLAFLIFTFLLPLSALSEIQQSIDREEIHAGESFVLTLRVEDGSDEEPDLSVIPKQLTIEGTTRYQNTQIFNGKATSIQGWKIKLKAVEPGTITIPAMDVAGMKTKPMTLEIKRASDSVTLNGHKKAIFITASVDQQEVWVQQQILFTLKLYRSVNTYYATLTSPWADNTIVEKIEQDKQYEQDINGRRYLVLERRFALFPQKSGAIEISPISFSGNVNVGSRRSFNNYLNGERPISVSTDKITVKVKPRPASWQGEWLPAKDLTLEESWEPADMSLSTGQPATWTVRLSAQGLSEDQLPEIKIGPSDGLQFYADSAQKERTFENGSLVGQKIQKFAVIPGKAGTFEIPAIRVRWWNTQQNKPMVAELPARKVTVTGAGHSSQPSTPASPSMGEQASEPAAIAQQPLAVDRAMTDPGKASPNTANSQLASLQRQLKVWQIVSLCLLTGWLVSLAWLRSKVRAQSSGGGQPDQLDSKRQERIKQQLSVALKDQQYAKACAWLPQWLSRSCGQNFRSIGAIKRLIKDDQLLEKLTNLEQLAFSALPQSERQLAAERTLTTQDLSQLEQSLRQAIRQQFQQSEATNLSELYS